MPLFGPPNIEKLKAKGNIKGLIKALGYKKDAAIRQAAAQALMEMGFGWSAVEALRKIGDARAVEPLIAALRDGDSDVRYKAARALWGIGDPRAIEPLIALLHDANKGIRLNAAETLVDIHKQGGLDARYRVLIFKQRATITEPHRDTPAEHSDGYEETESSDCRWTHQDCKGSHRDRGIGIDFPI